MKREQGIVLDEDVMASIERELEEAGVRIERYRKGADDRMVLLHAVERRKPLLTRNQGDFLVLHNEVEHYGILVDKYMNRRSPALVASTVSGLLDEFGAEIKNQVWFVSNYYGKY